MAKKFQAHIKLNAHIPKIPDVFRYTCEEIIFRRIGQKNNPFFNLRQRLRRRTTKMYSLNQ